MTGVFRTWCLLACMAGSVAAEGLAFPRDHHGHEGMSEEWWTLLAHVRDDAGRWRAVQASFHRFVWMDGDSGDAWPADVLYPALVALSDLDARTFAVTDRLERRGPGAAEYAASPVRIRHRAWMMAETDSTWRLDARVDSTNVALAFRARSAPVRLWAEGATDTTSATYRYAQALDVRGRVAGARVSGVGWLDHAWGDPVLPGKESGWELLTTHMRDGSALIVYCARSVSHQVDRRAGGVYMSVSGSRVSLDELMPRFYAIGSVRWVSDETGITYPTRWRVEVPALDLDVTVQPTFPNQELAVARTHGASLWRGSVEVSGKRGDQRITGAGFLELVGYGGRFPPTLAAIDD